MHDTLLRYAPFDPDGAFTGTVFHFLPFQLAANGRVGDFNVGRKIPTAMQLVAVAHDTDDRPLERALAVTGFAATAHFLPFQRSISARELPFAVTKLPTAIQTVVDLMFLHDTPVR